MKTILYTEILNRAAEAAGRTRDNLPLAETAILRSIFAVELHKVWLSEDWDDLRQPVTAVALDATKSFTNAPGVVAVTGAGSDEKNGNYYFDAGTGRYRLQNTDGLLLGPYIAVDATSGAATLYDAFNTSFYTAPALISAVWTVTAGQANAPVTTYSTAPLTLGEVLGVFDQPPDGATAWLRLGFYRIGGAFTVRVPLLQPRQGVVVPATVYVYYQSECPDLLALNQNGLDALTLPLVFGHYLALIGAGHLLTADGAASLAGMNFGLAKSQIDFERTRIQRPEFAKV